MDRKIYQRYICQPGLWARGIDATLGCNHVFNVEMVRYGKGRGEFTFAPDAPERMMVSCSYPRHEWNGKISGDWRVVCPACGNPSVSETGKRITGRVGNTACEEFCETAEGNTCNCQCGGANHGIRG